MTEGDATADLKRQAFAMIVEVLDSFEKLEVIAALDRAGHPQSLAELARATALDVRVIGEAVDGLVIDAVLARSSDVYRLDRDGPRGAQLAALLAVYHQDRLDVVTLMSRASLERMRHRASRAFADAFVLRRKGRPDG